MKLRHAVLGICVIAVSAVLVPTATAQHWPAQPIRLIVPFPPGGGTDILARLMAPKLLALLGQQIIVENKPGASSIIGSQLVARSAPDGYTLLISDSTFFINPGLRTDLPYDTLKDFEPVIHLAVGPVILVANPSFPATTVSGLVAQAKAHPGTLFYGSGAIGSPTQLAGELFNLATGVKISAVPFKGTGDVFAAVVANQVPLTFTGISSARPAIEAGQLRALAITGDRRNAAVPNVPTFVEAGVTGVDSSTHWIIVAPAKTPSSAVLALNAAMNKVLADPEIKTRIAGLGYDPVGGSPDDAARFTRNEIAKWTRVIRAAHISNP